MSSVQSVIIDKTHHSLPSAINWIKNHNFKNYKIDETSHYYRFRQLSPNNFNNFITKDIGNGIKLVIGFE